MEHAYRTRYTRGGDDIRLVVIASGFVLGKGMISIVSADNWSWREAWTMQRLSCSNLMALYQTRPFHVSSYLPHALFDSSALHIINMRSLGFSVSSYFHISPYGGHVLGQQQSPPACQNPRIDIQQRCASSWPTNSSSTTGMQRQAMRSVPARGRLLP